MSRIPVFPCRRSGMEGISMHDITLDDFPPNRLGGIAHWRNDPVVNKYLRPGLRTLAEVQAWYTQYFSRAEHQLFAVYCNAPVPDASAAITPRLAISAKMA